MSERNQYHLRLAIGACLGVSMAVAIELCSDGFLGQRTWDEIWIMLLRVFLVNFLIVPIVFFTWRFVYRKEHRFAEKDLVNSKNWIILMATLIVGQQLYDEIRHSHGLNEMWVRSAMVILGCAIGGLIFWLGFGRWYSARVAERKASMAAQSPDGGLS